MKRRVILTIHDNMLSIGEAFKLLDTIDYDHSYGWDRTCIWIMSDNHNVMVDIAKNKHSIKFDIWKDKEKQ